MLKAVLFAAAVCAAAGAVRRGRAAAHLAARADAAEAATPHEQAAARRVLIQEGNGITVVAFTQDAFKSDQSANIFTKCVVCVRWHSRARVSPHFAMRVVLRAVAFARPRVAALAMRAPALRRPPRFMRFVQKRDIALVKNTATKTISLRWFQPSVNNAPATEAAKSASEEMKLQVFAAAPEVASSVGDLTYSDCSDFVSAHVNAAEAWAKISKKDKKGGDDAAYRHASAQHALHKKMVVLTDDKCHATENNDKNVPLVSGLASRCLCFALVDKHGDSHVMRVIPDENDRHFTFFKDAKSAVDALFH